MRGRPALADAALSPDMMEVGDVRFGSGADMCGAPTDVRFTPNSDRESGFPQKVVSALHPKADMCSAK